MQIGICACPDDVKPNISAALSRLGPLAYDPDSLQNLDLIICDLAFYRLEQHKSSMGKIPFVVVAEDFEDLKPLTLPFEVSSSWDGNELLFRLRTFVPHFARQSSQGLVEIRSNSVFVNGVILELPRLLTAMLTVFLKNENRVLELTHFVSCFDEAPRLHTNIFTVYISKLRKKCNELGVHCFKFTSIRNRGYVFNIL